MTQEQQLSRGSSRGPSPLPTRDPSASQAGATTSPPKPPLSGQPWKAGAPVSLTVGRLPAMDFPKDFGSDEALIFLPALQTCREAEGAAEWASGAGLPLGLSWLVRLALRLPGNPPLLPQLLLSKAGVVLSVPPLSLSDSATGERGRTCRRRKCSGCPRLWQAELSHTLPGGQPFLICFLHKPLSP